MTTPTLTQRRISGAQKRLESPNVRAYIALAVGAVCIGFSAIFTKWASMDGGSSAFYRVAIATLALTVPYIVYESRRRGAVRADADSPRKLTRRVLWGTALAGLFFALDLAFWNTSLNFTSAANSTLLGNTSTLWVSLGATILFGESLRRRFWTGMALALVGAAIIVGPDLYSHPNIGWGDLLAVGSSLFYAGYILATGRVRKGIGTLPFMWLSSAVGTLFLFGYVLAAGQPLGGFGLNQWLALLGLALISHVGGWMAINYALGHLPAPLTSVSLRAQPVITALLAVPLLGEPISAYQIGGGLFVLLGIYIVNRRSAVSVEEPREREESKEREGVTSER
jgi:drug/metabolite transporter (DMT)-like permease